MFRWTKLDPRTLWVLVDCWQRRIAFGTTADIAGVSKITVRRWFRRFQEGLVYESPELQGVIEMDEAFLGRQRHGNQRIVLGAYERKTKKVVLRMTPNRDQGTTDRFLLRHVDRDSMIWTDGAKCYEGINTFFGYIHGSCNHDAWEFGPTITLKCLVRPQGFIRGPTITTTKNGSCFSCGNSRLAGTHRKCSFSALLSKHA